MVLQLAKIAMGKAPTSLMATRKYKANWTASQQLLFCSAWAKMCLLLTREITSGRRVKL